VVRGLKDIEVLKSYLFLTWSEWGTLWCDGFEEMCAALHEDFRGTGMGCHQADLIQLLDHVLWQLDRQFGYLKRGYSGIDEISLRRMVHQYQELREVLLEINIKTIARMSSYPTNALSYADSGGRAQDLAQHLCVRFLSHVHNFV